MHANSTSVQDNQERKEIRSSTNKGTNLDSALRPQLKSNWNPATEPRHNGPEQAVTSPDGTRTRTITALNQIHQQRRTSGKAPT
jgi:hypothetical protein